MPISPVTKQSMLLARDKAIAKQRRRIQYLVNQREQAEDTIVELENQKTEIQAMEEFTYD